MTERRIQWTPVLEHAADIVRSYDTGVTLRQLFYRLVADGTLPNLRTYYQRLSSLTAKGRRAGTFPSLLDRTSRIERYRSFNGPEEARTFLRDLYRRDRTEGQEWAIYLGVEKAGISAQLDAWFTGPLGIPHVALGGYPSQTLCDQVRREVAAERPAVLIYAGDFEPTGCDIDRDFEQRVRLFSKVIRVALNADQVEGLPENTDPEVGDKLDRDPRVGAFVRKYGEAVQYEVDALPPDELRDLYQTAIDGFWDEDAYEAVRDRERDDREALS